MSIYSLTHLTGRQANIGRKTVIVRFQVDRGVFLACLVGLLPGALLASVVGALLQPLMGSQAWSVALVVLPLGPLAMTVLLVGRQRSGMQLRHYQWLRNELGARRRGRARGNQNLRSRFLVGGEIIPSPAFVLSSQTSVWKREHR